MPAAKTNITSWNNSNKKFDCGVCVTFIMGKCQIHYCLFGLVVEW